MFLCEGLASQKRIIVKSSSICGSTTLYWVVLVSQAASKSVHFFYEKCNLLPTTIRKLTESYIEKFKYFKI